jgi:preprotein translocase subunit SecB
VDASQQPGIKLVTVFLSESSFRHRDKATPAQDNALGAAQIEVEVASATEKPAMLVSLRVNSDPEDSATNYDFDVTVVGVFEPMETGANMDLTQFALTNGAALLYPFAREVVANITGRGRFGPIWLNPFNMYAMFQTGAEQANAAGAAAKRGTKKRPVKSRN